MYVWIVNWIAEEVVYRISPFPYVARKGGPADLVPLELKIYWRKGKAKKKKDKANDSFKTATSPPPPLEIFPLIALVRDSSSCSSLEKKWPPSAGGLDLYFSCFLVQVASCISLFCDLVTVPNRWWLSKGTKERFVLGHYLSYHIACLSLSKRFEI